MKKTGTKIRGRRFKSAVDFLYLSDTDLYSLSREKHLGRIATLATDLCLRRLPKRAMVLSSKTVAPDPLKALDKVMGLQEHPELIEEFRAAISEVAKSRGHDVPAEEIWIDLPGGPKFKEGKDWPVKSEGAPNGYVRLRDVMPVDDWVKAFSENKWQGYIFTRPEFRISVFEASEVVLKEVFGIEVNKYAWILCKMDEEKKC